MPKEISFMVVGAMNLNRYVPGERPVRQAEHPYSHCLLSGIALYTMEEISFSTQHKKVKIMGYFMMAMGVFMNRAVAVYNHLSLSFCHRPLLQPFLVRCTAMFCFFNL